MTTWTNRGKRRLAEGSFSPGDLVMGLLTVSPSDAVARDWNVAADITGELTTAECASYARVLMGATTLSEDDAADVARIDYPNIEFGPLEVPAVTPGLQVNACVVIRNAGNFEVMWVQDLTAGVTPNGTDFTVVVPPTGLALVSD